MLASIPHGSSTVNDEHDVGYCYLEEGTTPGTLTLSAPDETGSRDVRLNSGGGSDGVEVASATFTVK